jgi:hypothetical protein
MFALALFSLSQLWRLLIKRQQKRYNSAAAAILLLVSQCNLASRSSYPQQEAGRHSKFQWRDHLPRSTQGIETVGLEIFAKAQ